MPDPFPSLAQRRPPYWGGPAFTGPVQGDLTIDDVDASPLEAAAARVRDALDRHTDREVGEALTRALGDSWTPESLAGRTSRTVGPETTYFLDGRPLLKIGAPVFSQVGNHLHYTLPVARYEWRPTP